MQRVKTGIKGLDDMLGGGFLPETANLVEGAPGTGKTTLGMQFIYEGITAYDEPGLIITFEEFPHQYYHDAANFGWDFQRLEKEGKLKIIMTSPEVSKVDLESVGGMIETHVTRMGARRVLVDSVTHLGRLTNKAVKLRAVEYGFINALKREGLTSILTHESSMLLGGAKDEGSKIAFVVDSYVLIRYVEIESAIHNAMLVLKMRGSAHAKDIREFEITSRGIEFVDREKSIFSDRENILSGAPTRRMADSFVEAFIKR